MHAILAARTHRPDVWALSEAELTALVNADAALLRHLPTEWLERSQLAVDIAGAAGAHLSVYGPRLAALRLPAPPANGAGAAAPLLRPIAPAPLQ